MAASGTFAPLINVPIGTPRPSVRMCRFTPLFARSVGFGAVRSPFPLLETVMAEVGETGRLVRSDDNKRKVARGLPPVEDLAATLLSAPSRPRDGL